MSILAHDWLGRFDLYAGFMSPLQGLLVGACDPGAAARLQRALPRAIPCRPSGAPATEDGPVTP